MLALVTGLVAGLRTIKMHWIPFFLASGVLFTALMSVAILALVFSDPWLREEFDGVTNDDLRGLAIHVILLGGVAVLTRLVTRVIAARFRHAPGTVCNRCGYDLRGSRMSTHCPECGAASAA